MNLANLRRITNDFQAARLVSLRNWSAASAIAPRDQGGPYVVSQEGYDPNDAKTTPDEFLLGRSGHWLSTKYFFQMPVAERRQEYVFGTAAEVAELMRDLPPQPIVLRPGEPLVDATAPEKDDMKAAFDAARPGGPADSGAAASDA